MVKPSIKEKLQKELNDLPTNLIFLVETSVENALEVNIECIRFFINKDLYTIILSANRPYSNLLDIYKKNNINTEKIIILDGVSKSKKTENKNVIFLGNLTDLTGISITLSDTYKQLKDSKTILFLDSIISMLIYSNPLVFVKFIHSILVKMRINNEGGILLSLEGEIEKGVRAEIAQLCDKVIKI